MPIEPLKEKLTAFGLQVFEIDGNVHQEIIDVFEKAKIFPDKPKAIIMKTISGKGVSFMEENYRWHGKAPAEHEVDEALWELK